jgi:hypothetical protein
LARSRDVVVNVSELKKEKGAVSESLTSIAAKEEVMQTWRDLVAQELIETDDEGEFE